MKSKAQSTKEHATALRQDNSKRQPKNSRVKLKRELLWVELALPRRTFKIAIGLADRNSDA